MSCFLYAQILSEVYLQASYCVGQELIRDKIKEIHCSEIILEIMQLQGSDREEERKRETEQQMKPAGAVKHLDRQISCYARDLPQGTSG